VAAALVGWALLGGGAERVRYAQVLGGPTHEGSTLAVLVRAIELDDQRRVPISGLALRLEARAGRANALASGTTDATGHLEARLDFGVVPAENPRLRIVTTARESLQLAEGEIALDVERWRAAARRDGGWLPGQARGDLRVRVAAESGAFAVPFAGQLLLQVLARPAGEAGDAEGSPVPGALVQLELDGAELLRAPPPTSAAVATSATPPTDAAGQTRVALRPLEHAVSARASVRAGERHGEWYGALPVIPGAIAVELSDAALQVRSPIAREHAFLSVVSARERIAGAIVPLAVDPDGSASGSFELTPALRARLEAEPLWAVLSSEFDKRSPGAMGWPLRPAFAGSAPQLGFTVPDAVLLDGRDGALYDTQQRQQRRRRYAAAFLLGVGLLLSAAFWNEVKRARGRPPRASGAGLGGPTTDTDHPDNMEEMLPLAPGGWVLGVALGCIALGLGALAYFGLLAR
jgi:hypothetical protein